MTPRHTSEWSILVAAASTDDCRLLEGLLRLAPGVDIRVVSAGLDEALGALHEETPLDAMILVTDRLSEVMEDYLVKCLRIGRVPVLVVSGRNDALEAVKALRLGAGGYLVKAFLSGAQLCDAIRDIVDHWDPALGVVLPRVRKERGRERHGVVGRARQEKREAEKKKKDMARTGGSVRQAVPTPREKPQADGGGDRGKSGSRAKADEHAAGGVPGGRPRMPISPGEITYSTSGIDAAMQQFGIERPRLLSDVLQEARRKTEALLNAIREDPDPVNYALLVTVASLLQEHVRDIRDVNAALAYHYGPEDYFGGSAVDAALLVHILCMADGMPEQERVQLVTAALLHDVGFVVAGMEPSTDPVALARHCEEGARCARLMGAPLFVPEAIRQHEEHADGSGLPAGLQGDQILREAQFILLGVTCSDLFAGRVEHPGGESLPTYRGAVLTARDPHTSILRDLRAWFRPDVLRLFIMQAGFYAVGTLVELSNRAVARVISQNPGHPSSPVVEIVNRPDGSRPDEMTLVDLSKHPALSISRVLSHEHEITR